MTGDRYKSLMDFWASHRRSCLVMGFLDRAITVITAVLFLGASVYYIYLDRRIFEPFVIVPAIAFVLVSIFRKLLGAPRPYEVYESIPALKKESKKNSFPSRHVFSVFVIGMAFWQKDVRIAAGVFVMGIILAVIRVLGGVHFFRDVIAGAAMGIAFGAIGFYFFPG